MVACGHLFHTNKHVILWTDQYGYDGYCAESRFSDGSRPKGAQGSFVADQRYDTLRRNLPPSLRYDVAKRGWRLDQLQQQVDLFVIHYDVCGTARCYFKALHDLHCLSVHFLLEVDGTIYQTLP